MEAIAIRLEAIPVRLEAIAICSEAIAIGSEAIAICLEAIAICSEAVLSGWRPLLLEGRIRTNPACQVLLLEPMDSPSQLLLLCGPAVSSGGSWTWVASPVRRSFPWRKRRQGA